jgi:cell division transport system ATP-binding protein
MRPMPPAITESTSQTPAIASGRPEPVGRPSALVELRGAVRRYGKLVALRDVDLVVEPGEFVFLIGPSEAGKTTLLKLIHGDLRPNKGTVRVDRYQLARRWRRFLPRLRREVAAVFQDGRLLPDMTARGNVGFALQVADLGMPRREVRARAQARLDEVGLGGRPTAYPHQLSGGQQRRLAIARALGHDPVLVLADEPTANLDRDNAERVVDLLERRCAAGTTVIVATHDVELARARPHRIIELREGRIVADLPARAPLPGNGAAASLLAARHLARPGLRARTGRAMQLLLGYTPPPPPVRRRPQVGIRVRAGRATQFVLGYAPPPRSRRRALPARAAWTPPREVLERLTATGPANGSTNGSSHGSTNGSSNGGAVGAWRPPRSLALAPVGPAAPGSGGKAARRRRLQLAGRASSLARLVLGHRPPPARTAPRPGLRRQVGRVMQLVLGYTPPPEAPRRPRRANPRRPWTPVANLARLSVGGAVASWLRNFRTVAPALGSITLLLLLAGVLSVSSVAVRSLLAAQSAEASLLHVYLSDEAANDQVDQSRQALAELPHVRSVTYVSKDQALAEARQRPGLGDLASLSDSNPFPASFTVRVDSPNNVAGVARMAAGQPGIDTRQPTSYDADTFQRLRQFTIVAASVAGGFGLLLLAITYVISSNSIRAAVLARRDELLTMQLVGASPWLIRARLAVEGALTGGLAGVLAAALVVAAIGLALVGARHLFVQVLPGLTMLTTIEVLAAVTALGICLGAVSALFAFRRLRT